MTKSAALLLIAIAAAAQAQVDSTAALDELAGLIDRGNLRVEVNLKPGRAALTPEWTIETVGSPTATLTAEANHGQIECVTIDVTGGQLFILGKGLRPRLSIEGMQFEGGGIVDARVRGRGAWRPVIAMFRTLARPALRHLDVPTDIRSILMGQILSSNKSSSGSSSDSLALVRDVRVKRSDFEAFPAYPLAFGDLASFQTTSLHAGIENAMFTPPAHFVVDGRIDGDIEDGSAAFIGAHCRFARGKLQRGTFHVDGDKTSFAAGALTVDLTSGIFHLPGGPKVDVEAPSNFAVRDLRVKSDGSYSGVVDATVSGNVGTIDRGGVALAANKIRLRTHGAKIVDGRATGDVAVEFQYRLSHTLTIHYPVEELRDRHVPLNFDGVFAADLHLDNAGSGDEGSVTGDYQFTIPWPPVEQAAFEVLRAKWEQDIAPAIHRVDFAIEPRRFGPCGHDCFLLDLKVVAQKPKAKGYWFQQTCDTEGKADVVIDAPTRTLFLRNLRVQPRCQGVLGAIVNFIAPFVTKSYSDVALLQMPKELPFTIASIGTSSDSIVIAGKVAWAASP